MRRNARANGLTAMRKCRQGQEEGVTIMGSGLLVGLALGSIIFFSVILVTAALMMRGQWDKLGGGAPPEPRDPARRPPPRA
ncbi:MAG TPA: hypothetical protein VF808_01430 [Ktedonobacterales bacterium]